MIKRHHVLVGLVAAFLGVLGSGLHAQTNAPPQSPAMDRPGLGSSRLPADSAYDGFSKTYSRPPSEWQNREKALYLKLFAGQKFDVLVLPFQVSNSGFDRSTRLLMAAELAAGIARSGDFKVADPFVVARALGDGQRQLNEDDIQRLAEAVGARRVIQGYAGHDRQGKLSLTIAWRELQAGKLPAPGASGVPIKHVIENIPFGDEAAPIRNFEVFLPTLLAWLDLNLSVAEIKPLSSKLDIATLPQSPKDLIGLDDNPARDAYVFLLQAALTPKNVERTQEHFAEKAYLAVLRLSPTAPEYRALRARTLMVLGHRLAAIKALGTPVSNEEIGLSAALNGNLPMVSDAAQKEKNQLKRVLQKLDENDIATTYAVRSVKQSSEEAAALKLPGNIWPFLVDRAFTEWDSWSQYDNASLKSLLDFEFPVKGYSIEEVVQGLSRAGEVDKVQAAVNLSVFAHGQKVLEANPAQYCCNAAFSRPAQADYLDLLLAMGHDNLIRRVTLLSSVQGLPQRAIDYANTIDVVYRGNPDYTLERSRSEARLAANAVGAEKAELLKTAHEHAFAAYYWEQGQSRVSSGAFDQVAEFARSYDLPLTNLYSKDIPYHPYYPTWSDGGAAPFIQNRVSALKNAKWEVFALSAFVRHYWRFYPGDEARVDELLKTTEGRFIGSTVRNELLATAAIRRGDPGAAEALYRQSIQFSPTRWSPYELLGGLLFEAGKVSEAQKVFLAYPGFKKGADENRAQIANAAYESGSRFYWAGHLELALPLYEISASQHAGAASDISSATRLKLLSGDIQGAMEGTLERAERYSDSYAYRDYLGMLHATGHSKEAWAEFDVLVRQIQKPHIWETAMVGHRMAEQSEAQVAEWAKQPHLNNLGMSRSAGAIYLLRYATTDRVPSEILPEVLQVLDGPRVAPGQQKISIYSARPPSAAAGMPRVKSALSYFAQAYRAFKLKDYAGAKTVLDEAAGVYRMSDAYTRNTPDASFLPYYAYVAAKAGDTSGVEKIVGEFKIQDQLFDYCLAKAVLAGVAGNTQQALEFLQLARHRRPNTEDRPFLTQYTYGEITELLAEETKDERLRVQAVEWAKHSQKVEPWQAWPYAMEAKLSTKPGERKRAMAMAFYLDPKSERLATLQRSQIDAAVKEFGASNLFLNPKRGKPNATVQVKL